MSSDKNDRTVIKKTRVGILEEAIDRGRYRMSLHPNFSVHFKEGNRVYFEIIDSDGKLKRAICSVTSVPKTSEQAESLEATCDLECEKVINVVEGSHTDLASLPSPGKVVYLFQESSRE